MGPLKCWVGTEGLNRNDSWWQWSVSSGGHRRTSVISALTNDSCFMVQMKSNGGLVTEIQFTENSPTLSSLVASEVVVMTTSGAACDDKVGITITVGFHCASHKICSRFVVWFYFRVIFYIISFYSHDVVTRIFQGCFTGTRAIIRLPKCRWINLEGYGLKSVCP